MNMLPKTEADCEMLYELANKAGLRAAEKCVPTPMVVGEPTNFFSNDIDYNKPIYYVPDGVCGFATIIIKPGNSKFANWLKKRHLAKKDSYYGGVYVFVREFGQSYEKKKAYAYAFANVLENAGFDRCWVESRLD